jgi:hypothetical protein
MKQEDKIWTTEPLVFIILLAFGLWIAYDFGESQGMKKSEKFLCFTRMEKKRMQTMDAWLKCMHSAFSPNSGINLSAQERQEMDNMLFIRSDQSKLTPIEEFCKDIIRREAPVLLMKFLTMMT